MKTILRFTLVVAIIVMLSSCALFRGLDSSKYAKDPVCGMKVLKANALSYKYEDKMVYFDKEACKQAFIMNPRKFFVP